MDNNGFHQNLSSLSAFFFNSFFTVPNVVLSIDLKNSKTQKVNSSSFLSGVDFLPKILLSPPWCCGLIGLDHKLILSKFNW